MASWPAPPHAATATMVTMAAMAATATTATVATTAKTATTTKTAEPSQLPVSGGRAFVESVLSGDSVVLRGRPAGGPPARLVVGIAGIAAPRIGAAKDPSKEEPLAFEAREFVRRALVGKEVAYRCDSAGASGGGRPYASLLLRAPVAGESDAARIVVAAGWARARSQPDARRPSSEDPSDLAALEDQARAAKLGIWCDSPTIRKVNYTLDKDPRQFFDQFKGKPIDAVIEQVRDGSNLRVLLSIPENDDKIYQYISISITGIRAPTYRKGIPNVEDLVEPFAEEAKFFVESRLLQRDVRVILESLAPGTSPSFVGTIQFQAGNIAEALLAEGLAKVVDWNLSVLTTPGAAAAYRLAEDRAKARHARLWQNYTAEPARPAGSITDGSEFDATVTRILGSDMLVIEPIHMRSKEHKVQLASIRGVKRQRNDAKFDVGYAPDAIEFLRSRLIGKQVHVRIDYVKPAEGEYEARECVTLLLGEQNIAEALVSRGLASVVRHRKDDNSRASAYDKLLIAEERAQKASKGIHSTKELPVHRITDASESAAKSRQFLPYLQRSATVSGVVEFVASGSRFRVSIPSQSCRITLVLGGIRTPRAARNPGEKSEPFGSEAAEFSSRLVLQREVEIVVDGVDKVGGFIGSLFVQQQQQPSPSIESQMGNLSMAASKINLAVALLEEGLASVHEYSASQSQFTNQLYDAETRAKAARVKIWADYDPDKEAQSNGGNADGTGMSENAGVDADAPVELRQVLVSEMGEGGIMYLQIFGPDLARLETFMAEFAQYHATTGSHVTDAFNPRMGDICSAQYSEDKCWYRARVVKVTGTNTYTVHYIDYGNSETVQRQMLRPLPPKFSTTQLKAQAVASKLAYVDFPETVDATDAAGEAYALLRALTGGGKPLSAQVVGKSVVASTGAQAMSIVLYDVAPPAAASAFFAKTPSMPPSVNEKLVREGLVAMSKPVLRRYEQDQRAKRKQPAASLSAWSARSSTTATSSSSDKKTLLDAMVEAQEAAKKERVNLWQYGDFTADDEL